MIRWTEIPISDKLFLNVDETTLSVTLSGLENAFITEAGAHTRFPGLKPFVDIGTNEILYPTTWRGNLMASTSQGRLLEIDRNGTYRDRTKVPISGGGRPTFAETDDSLLAAAGGPIIQFAGKETEILSEDAPETTHVGYIDGYVVAIETRSNRFFHSNVGAFRTWDPLDVFAANANPDDLTALIVTPFGELILFGERSIEQFEPLASGTTPFARRWRVSEGIHARYTPVFTDNAVWAVSQDLEMTRYSGQTSNVASDDIQRVLHTIDDWTGAWAEDLNIKGKPFIILQVPNATTVYGNKGYTFVLDTKAGMWTLLYGSLDENGNPTIWPGSSIAQQWQKTYVGGVGKIWELDAATFQNDSQSQRVIGRTAHVGDYELRADNVRMKIKRGVGSNTVDPKIMLRCKRDNGVWSKWKVKGLGKAGHGLMDIEFGGYGCAHDFQFEWACTDNCQFELARLEWQTTPL